MYLIYLSKILFHAANPHLGAGAEQGVEVGEGNSLAPERSLNQVAAPDTRNLDRSQSLPIRYKEASLQKRRALNITSNELVCFLCGAPHFPRACRTYPNAKVQETPCSNCKFYHESSLCKSNPRRNSTSRSNLSHN